MRVWDCNWMQLEEYLARDDRIVLPLGSTEQHAYLSLGTDSILAERVSVEAAEPLGVPVLPVLAYGLTPYFGAFPGSPTLRVDTFLAVLRDLLDSLNGQGFHRVLLGRNAPDTLPAPYLDGLESPADGFNIIRGLIARGYDDASIRKIAGQNALDFFRRTFG